MSAPAHSAPTALVRTRTGNMLRTTPGHPGAAIRIGPRTAPVDY